jgi:hypothetical protein
MTKKQKPALSPQKLQKLIAKRLEPLEEMNFLERYAMFMGMAQIIEMELKGILIRNHGETEERLEKTTLGGAILKLKKAGIRSDFIELLWDLNDHRRKMAHEFLAVFSLLQKHAQAGQLSRKSLQLALFTAEKTIQVYDFLNENNYLYPQTIEGGMGMRVGRTSRSK